MKIGLISDSHIPASTRALPEQVFHAFQGVDLILHTGDIYTAATLDALEAIAPVLAVGDGTDQFIGQPRVEAKRVLAISGVHVGLVHRLDLPGINGDVLPGLVERQVAPHIPLSEALRQVFGQSVQVCVFGDTHHELVEQHEGVLLINPGSPTLPRQMRRLGTVVRLEITVDAIAADILDLASLPGAPPEYI